MRFKLGRKTSLRMKKHGTLCALILCCIAAQNFLPETNALQTLRLRGRRFRTTNPTSSPTTPAPTLSSSTSTSQPSSEVTTSLPSLRLKFPIKPLPTGRRKRIRVRRLRVGKRQGALLQTLPMEDGGTRGRDVNQPSDPIRVREPLYQEHADEVNVPDHYYSPIRRQRMRGNRKLFKESQEVVQFQPVQQYHKSSLESHSASNPNLEFRRREKERRRYRPVPVAPTEGDGDNYNQNPDEYTPQQSQPAPKNYAFAYAVRDDGNTDDNNFSHKEARDGKLTMGEYRINLPDGRVQVVRYTAGGDIGYKADVTYEGEGDDHPKKPQLIAKPTPYTAGNDGYLPPSLSPQFSTSSPPPKKYRKKKPKNPYQNYGTSPRPTSPAFYGGKVNGEDDFGNFKYSAPPTLSSPRERPISYDKYEDGPPQEFYSSYGKGQSQPSSTPRPYRRPRPNYDNDNYPSPTPTVYSRSDPSPSPQPYGRPKVKKSYENVPSHDTKEYDENLSFVHEKSPRAGPTREKNDLGGPRGRDKNIGSSSAIGGYGYPGHPELEHEIQTLKQSHKPFRPQQPTSPSFDDPFDKPNFKYKPQRNPRPSPKPESTPAALYNEPGPGNYFTAVNGPPSSPSPPPRQKQFFTYPKTDYRNPPTPTPSHNYIDDHGYHNSEDENRHPSRRNKFEQTEPRPPTPPFGGYTPISFKSGSGKELIPIEDFKAGPARKNFKTIGDKKPSRLQPQQKYRQPPPHPSGDHYYDEQSSEIRAGPTSKPKKLVKQPESVAYKEPYDYYNSQHPSYHHGGYIPPTPPTPTRIRSQPHPSASPSPATSYTIDFPGGQHSFYLKTGPGSKVKSVPTSPTPYKYQSEQFHHESRIPYRSSPSPTTPTPRKKQGNGSGLVFFETPGTGPRPTQGVKDLLSQLPNISGGSHFSSTPSSFPNTVIHPYEVGRKDYGHAVGYKNSFNTPSSGEESDHEQEGHRGHEGENEHPSSRDRDYLFDNGQEVVVATPEFESHRFRSLPSPSPTPAEQFHYRKSLLAKSQSSSRPLSPPPNSGPGSTPESLQDIDYQQNYQLLQPVSPTPAISTSHFHTPIHDYSDPPSNADYGIDPRHRGSVSPSPLRFSTISEADVNLRSVAQQPQSDLNYQYQYEEGVK